MTTYSAPQESSSAQTDSSSQQTVVWQEELITLYSSIRNLASIIRLCEGENIPLEEEILLDFPQLSAVPALSTTDALGKKIGELATDWLNQSPQDSAYLARSEYIAVNLLQLLEGASLSQAPRPSDSVYH